MVVEVIQQWETGTEESEFPRRTGLFRRMPPTFTGEFMTGRGVGRILTSEDMLWML